MSRLLALLVACVCVGGIYSLAATQQEFTNNNNNNRDGIKVQMDELLSAGVTDKVYPAVVGIAMTADGSFQYANAFGHLNYSTDSPKSGFDVNFDLASLSKGVATTTAVALLYQRGYVSLDDKITQYLGDGFGSNGKEGITVLNCLLHNAGFPPDPVPWYWAQEFGCPNTTPDETIIPAEDFSCLSKQYSSLLYTQYLDHPTGEVYVYSDLSFITLQMVIGAISYNNKLVGAESLRTECVGSNTDNLGVLYTCYFEAFVRTEVFEFKSSHVFVGAHEQYRQQEANKHKVLMPHTGYVIPASEYANSVETIDDTGPDSYSHHRFQGQVSDGDCYSMGGICGHAGVFSTGIDMSRFLSAYVAAMTTTSETDANSVFMLNATTIAKFTKMYNISQSSRALGWTTNTPLVSFAVVSAFSSHPCLCLMVHEQVKDYGFDNSCGTLSELTFMHTGYTGGCICVDPVNKAFSIVLSNRSVSIM
jgi:CubicO group peptidase (beta-lactamase class C family)